MVLTWPLPQALAQAQPGPEASVVKVQCQTDTNQTYRGSGFGWPDKDHVVTALHMVAGCKTLSVSLRTTVWTAEIEKVLARSDLALLRLVKVKAGPTISIAPLSRSPTPPDTNLPHDVWGFPRGWIKPTAKKDTATIKQNAEPLVDSILAIDAYKAQLGGADGVPASNSNILKITSEIRSGHSGSPILENGAVVAIADGGLHEGITGKNWAIPADRLMDLHLSKEPMDKIIQQRLSWPILFSAEESKPIDLGDHNSLVYIWSAPIEQIIATTTRDERDDLDQNVRDLNASADEQSGAAPPGHPERLDLSGLWHAPVPLEQGGTFEEIATIDHEGSNLVITIGDDKMALGNLNELSITSDLAPWAAGTISEDGNTIRWESGQPDWQRSALTGELDIYQDYETQATIAVPEGATPRLDRRSGVVKVTAPKLNSVAMYMMIAENGGAKAEEDFLEFLNKLVGGDRWQERPATDTDQVEDTGQKELDQELYIPVQELEEAANSSATESPAPDSVPAITSMFMSTKTVGERFMGTAVVSSDERGLSAEALRWKALLKLCVELSAFPDLESR